jgi:toxin ParE1/3/4
MRLIWSLWSMEDRETIFDYIERDNFQAAVHTDDRIEEHAGMLVDYPELGRDGRVSGTRELVIPNTPYIAAYCIVGEEIRILRVLHGAQEWPESFQDS